MLMTFHSCHLTISSTNNRGNAHTCICIHPSCPILTSCDPAWKWFMSRTAAFGIWLFGVFDSDRVCLKQTVCPVGLLWCISSWVHRSLNVCRPPHDTLCGEWSSDAYVHICFCPPMLTLPLHLLVSTKKPNSSQVLNRHDLSFLFVCFCVNL